MAIKYYLLAKTTQKFINYTNQPIRLSKATPYTVDEVLIAKKGKKTPCKKITTFRDSNGNMIERIFNFHNQPLRNRLYTRKENTIGENEIVNSTTIKEFSLKRCLIDLYRQKQAKYRKLNIRTTLWKERKVQTNHVSENVNNGDKFVSVSTIQNSENKPSEALHRIVEYPGIKNGKIEHKPPKSLEYRVDENFDVDSNSIKTDGVKAPVEDSYLGYRLLTLEDAKEPLIKRFMRDRGVDGLGYSIDTDFMPEDGSETLCGLFNDGTIQINKLRDFKSKASFVSTSRHEVEHGWQYYLDARNGGQRGEFLEELGSLHGEIKNKKLKKEADTYTQSLNNYVPYYKDYERYRKNYIEIKAKEAGAKAKKEYNEQGKIIRDDFPHVPKEVF